MLKYHLISFTLPKSFFLLFLSNIRKVESQHRNAYCQEPNRVVFHWNTYPPEIIPLANGSAGGFLPSHLRKVFPICCPELKLSFHKMNATSSEHIESLIRNDSSSHLSFYFPVFAQRREEKQYGRPFIALYNSPGLAILSHDQDSGLNAKGMLKVLYQSWRYFALLILLSVTSGIVIWALVSNTYTFLITPEK